MKDYGKALESFSQALLSRDAGLQSSSHYNLGNTLYQTGRRAKSRRQETDGLDKRAATLRGDAKAPAAEQGGEGKSTNSLKEDRRAEKKAGATADADAIPIAETGQGREETRQAGGPTKKSGEEIAGSKGSERSTEGQPGKRRPTKPEEKKDKSEGKDSSKDSGAGKDKEEQSKPGETPSPSPGKVLRLHPERRLLPRRDRPPLLRLRKNQAGIPIKPKSNHRPGIPHAESGTGSSPTPSPEKETNRELEQAKVRPRGHGVSIEKIDWRSKRCERRDSEQLT